MAEMSRGFNEFWEHVDEVLAENEAVMADKVRPLRRPGEIGSVVTRLSFQPDSDPLPDPPEAA